VQNNNPKHFLPEEEFVQLRLELSKDSLLAMIGEVEDAPAAHEELPPGTDDLVDPAKVCIHLQGRNIHQSTAFRGLPGACLFSMRWKALFRCEEVSFVSSQATECQGGIQVGIHSGNRPKTKRIN